MKARIYSPDGTAADSPVPKPQENVTESHSRSEGAAQTDPLPFLSPLPGCGFFSYGHPWGSRPRLSARAATRLKCATSKRVSEEPQVIPSLTLRVAALAIALAAPLIGMAQQPAQITNSIGMRLAAIPAGKFKMGSPATEPEREQQELQHEVVITRPFYMGVYEVTQGQVVAVLGADRKRSAFFDENRGGGPDHPIENIEWKSAAEFCAKLSALPAEQSAGRKYRLPTEAEWEYACRAGTTTPFHCGDSLSSSQANSNGSEPFFGAERGPYLKKTVKVGSYPPNAFGLHDMHGNVAEFCADWYAKDYYAKRPAEDPPGPPEGASSDDFGNTYLVVRGGCWLDDARACRSAYRYRAMSTNRYPQYGFRVVCEMDAAAGAR